MDEVYFCNRCMYAWSNEHPPYCPYCGGTPTHEIEDKPEHIGVELEPGMWAHVSPDIQPETLEALREMMRKAAEQFGDTGS